MTIITQVHMAPHEGCWYDVQDTDTENTSRIVQSEAVCNAAPSVVAVWNDFCGCALVEYFIEGL